jgi:hypothetical protein
VELETTGTPITSIACYCKDCQAGSRQIEALPNAPSVRGPDGGCEYVLYRKDRIRHSKGAELLQDYRISEQSATSRVVASCCNSAMCMQFDDSRHWIPVYRARLQPGAPAVEMRICTRSRPGNADLPGDVRNYPGLPIRFVARLLAANVAMLLRR